MRFFKVQRHCFGWGRRFRLPSICPNTDEDYRISTRAIPMCSSPGVCGDPCRPNQTSRGTPLRGTLSQRRIVSWIAMPPDHDGCHGSGAHEMVERIDGQKCEPGHRQDRAAVLARRVVGSLPARLQSTQPDSGVYRKQPGFRRAGVLRGALALVQCRLAGETACPTKTCQSTGQM
jgi:hypothetical protein